MLIKHLSLHEPTLSASFLPTNFVTLVAETRGRKPERRCHHVLTNGIAVCGGHPIARGTPPRTPQSADGHEGRPGEKILCWMDREVRAGENPTVPAPPTHMPVQKMGPQDDPEAFLDLFEKTAAACGWPQTDWPVRLIPLLTGERSWRRSSCQSRTSWSTTT